MRELPSLSLIGRKIRAIRSLWHSVEKDIYKLPAEHISIDEVSRSFESLIDHLITMDKRIVAEVETRLVEIGGCPFGEGENRSRNAMEFQRNVVELLSWLFIDELKLLQQTELREEQLRRDGVFEVQDDFDFVERGLDRFRFSHVVVECKNYHNPSYRDLMQLYAYTLLNRVYPLVNKPLCLLVSCTNPNTESVATKMRNKLFEGDGISQVLVLFLSCDDLKEMVKMRKDRGDPFLAMKQKIDKIHRDNAAPEK